MPRSFWLYVCNDTIAPPNLLLAAIRVLKKLVQIQDPSFVNYIINKDLLTPVVDKFLEHGNKYTIFNSAALELFAVIGAVCKCTKALKNKAVDANSNFSLEKHKTVSQALHDEFSRKIKTHRLRTNLQEPTNYSRA